MPWEPPALLDPVRKQVLFDEPSKWQIVSWIGWYEPLTVHASRSPRLLSIARSISDWHHLSTDQIRRYTGINPADVSRTLKKMTKAGILERARIGIPPNYLGYVYRFGKYAEKWWETLTPDLQAEVAPTGKISRRRGAVRHDLAAASLALAMADHPRIVRIGTEYDSRAAHLLSTTAYKIQGDFIAYMSDGTEIIVEITADSRSAKNKVIKWGKFLDTIGGTARVIIVFVHATKRTPLRYTKQCVRSALTPEGMGSLATGLEMSWIVDQARAHIMVADWTDWLGPHSINIDLPVWYVDDYDSWQQRRLGDVSYELLV